MCQAACVLAWVLAPTDKPTHTNADVHALMHAGAQTATHAARGLHKGHLFFEKLFRDRSKIKGILQQLCPFSLGEMHFGHCMLEGASLHDNGFQVHDFSHEEPRAMHVHSHVSHPCFRKAMHL
jgi:hypothetical protein